MCVLIACDQPYLLTTDESLSTKDVDVTAPRRYLDPFVHRCFVNNSSILLHIISSKSHAGSFIAGIPGIVRFSRLLRKEYVSTKMQVALQILRGIRERPGREKTLVFVSLFHDRSCRKHY